MHPEKFLRIGPGARRALTSFMRRTPPLRHAAKGGREEQRVERGRKGRELNFLRKLKVSTLNTGRRIAESDCVDSLCCRQILSCVLCPLLIPLIAAVKDELLFRKPDICRHRHRDVIHTEQQSRCQRARRCVKQHVNNVVDFYRSPIAKYCSHMVRRVATSSLSQSGRPGVSPPEHFWNSIFHICRGGVAVICRPPDQAHL